MKTDRPGILVGAGAQGRVIAAIWQRAEPDRELVFLDDNPTLWQSTVAGIRVAGGLESLPQLLCQEGCVIVAVGNNYTRTRLAAKVGDLNRFTNVIDPSAAIMPGSRLGTGIFVGPQAVVHTGAQVGHHAVINTGVLVEHDCVIEAGASLSPGVCMAGRVHIEKHAFLSTGVTLVGRLHIGEGAIIGAGAVVTSDIPPNCVAYGVPARVVRQATPQDWQRLF